MYNLIDLTDRKIIVVGASQGIGQETSILLSSLGARLILLARNEVGLQETLSMLEGEGHIYRLLDVSQLDRIEETAKEIVEATGPIDGIVYCAGITGDRPLAMLRPEDFEKVLAVNLKGFVEIVRCLSAKKRFNAGMRIVAISSVASKIGRKAHLAYSSSKAGVNSAVQCMAKELADKGIAVNAVAPGMIYTQQYVTYLEGSGGENGAANRGLLDRQYLGIGEVTDVATAVSFLLCPASRFITGICLPVDGGYLSN